MVTGRMVGGGGGGKGGDSGQRKQGMRMGGEFMKTRGGWKKTRLAE